MPYRQLTTIPMPTGVAGNTLRTSVALVPRLHEEGELRDYADDWAQWPAISGALDLRVFFNNMPNPINPLRVQVVSDPPRLDLWEALFGNAADSKQPVRQYRFIDRRATALRSFPSAEVVDGLRDLYAEISDKYAEEPPAAKEVLELTASAILKGSTLIEAEEYLESTADPADGEVVPTEGPGLEFHEMLTILRAHPHLLRLLGLVIDLEIDLQPGAPRPGRIRVQTNWAATMGVASRDECALAMNIGPDQWSLPLFPDEHEGPYLKLSDGQRYAMSTSDLVSASQTLLDYQRTTIATGEYAPIPAPPEAGVAVVHTDLPNILQRRFDRQRLLEDDMDAWFTSLSNTPPEIWLEDVAIGYRYDVLDADDPTWRSLFERHAVDGYEFPRDDDLEVDPPDDEGRWTLAATTEGQVVHAGLGTQVTYTQEGKPDIKKSEATDKTMWRLPVAAFRWNGWSSAAPNPGSSLTASGDVAPPADNAVTEDQEAQMEVSYRPVLGTLPRLRYGRTYQMRARATDLAGNSMDVEDKEPENSVSGPMVFGRTQPVEPPLPIRVEPRATPGVGDLAATLVVKSEQDQDDSDVQPTARALFPPRLSQARLELHGLPEGGIDPGSYEFLVERDALRLDDQTAVDEATGELVLGSFDGDGNHVPVDEQPIADYLVDPAAVGVTIGGSPGEEEPVVVPYRNDWPDQRALEVELRAGDDGTEVPVNETVAPVRFFVPKGRVRHLELSHGVDAPLVDHFDAFRVLSADRRSEVRGLVERGRHHVISARSPLTLVHAVRVPVDPAAFSGADPAVTVDREYGSRFAAISGGITLDRPSTERIRVIGEWTDPIDDLSLPAPTTRTAKADQVVPVHRRPEEWDRVGVLEDEVLDLVDTKRHTVTLELEAFSRFSRYFTEQVDGFQIPAATGEAELPVDEGVVPRSVNVTAADGTELVRDEDFEVDRESGTITRLPSGAMQTDVDHTVRYIPLPISRSSVDAPWGTATQVFPATVRPVPPVVADVVPAANRRIVERSNRIIVIHDGRVLRVMLKRPWWSSGEDERLGVLLDQSPAGVPERTRWGRDPLIAGGDSLAVPAIAHFPSAIETASEVDVDVAAHEVYFDEERQVWIADVAIDAEIGERPFVQLALARYQSAALDGLALSTEVQTGPVRLGPRRRIIASQTATPGDVLCVMRHAPTGHSVQVRIQRADPAITDPDLRWNDVIDNDEPLVQELDAKLKGLPRHRGVVTLPVTTDELRLVFEDREPVTRTDAATGDPVPGHEIVYRETIEVPATWKP